MLHLINKSKAGIKWIFFHRLLVCCTINSMNLMVHLRHPCWAFHWKKNAELSALLIAYSLLILTQISLYKCGEGREGLMSLCFNAMSKLGLCKPGGVSARVEQPVRDKFCSLITANVLCAQTVFVHIFPLPPQYLGSLMVEPAACQCKKKVPALSAVSGKICWMQGKAVVHGRKAELEKLSSTFWKNAWRISAEYSELTWSHLWDSRNTAVGKKTSPKRTCCCPCLFMR